MSGSVIGAQLYTLRDHLKTPPDIAATLARVRKMGYEAVQVSAVGPIEPTELAKILKNEGLTVAATHVSLDLMRDVSKCLDYHATLGCKYTAIGGFFQGVELADPAAAAERLKIGTRVQTRFKDQRVGDVLDFWFEPTT